MQYLLPYSFCTRGLFVIMIKSNFRFRLLFSSAGAVFKKISGLGAFKRNTDWNHILKTVNNQSFFSVCGPERFRRLPLLLWRLKLWVRLQLFRVQSASGPFAWKFRHTAATHRRALPLRRPLVSSALSRKLHPEIFIFGHTGTLVPLLTNLFYHITAVCKESFFWKTQKNDCFFWWYFVLLPIDIHFIGPFYKY